MVGKTILTFQTLGAIFQGTASSSQVLTFTEFRLPRACLALIAGGAFGFSGFVLQGVTRNELADASIVGINNGAGLFVMIYLGVIPKDRSFYLSLGSSVACWLLYWSI